MEGMQEVVRRGVDVLLAGGPEESIESSRRLTERGGWPACCDGVTAGPRQASDIS
jgi:hypothetical protein